MEYNARNFLLKCNFVSIVTIRYPREKYLLFTEKCNVCFIKLCSKLTNVSITTVFTTIFYETNVRFKHMGSRINNWKAI